MELPTLESVLSYKNPAVLKLYVQNYPTHFLSAELAFEEVLKYLWLTQKLKMDKMNRPDDPTLPQDIIMLRSMREIDDMWHEFILFTEDYTEFCHQFFNEYLHHLPNIFDNAPSSWDEVKSEVSKLLPYVHEHLGEDTLKRWYAPYL